MEKLGIYYKYQNEVSYDVIFFNTALFSQVFFKKGVDSD